MERKQLVTTGEMARILDISTRQLYRLLAQGRIPFIRAGRYRRYDPEKVIAALEKEQEDA